jgi:septum formation protein
MNNQNIILASQSPRRKQLLDQATIAFKVVVVPTEENYPPNLAISEVPIYIAKNKANAVLELTNESAIIIAADTVVVLQNEIIGKPKDKDDAFSILKKLSNNIHQVITGYYITDGNKTVFNSTTTTVEFNKLSDDMIHYYIEHYAPYDKAGAYAIQEWIGAVGIKSIVGDFYNVMGLPINEIYRILKTW